MSQILQRFAFSTVLVVIVSIVLPYHPSSVARHSVLRLVVFGYQSAAVTYTNAIDLCKRFERPSISGNEKLEKLLQYPPGNWPIQTVVNTLKTTNRNILKEIKNVDKTYRKL